MKLAIMLPYNVSMRQEYVIDLAGNSNAPKFPENVPRFPIKCFCVGYEIIRGFDKMQPLIPVLIPT